MKSDICLRSYDLVKNIHYVRSPDEKENISAIRNYDDDDDDDMKRICQLMDFSIATGHLDKCWVHAISKWWKNWGKWRLTEVPIIRDWENWKTWQDRKHSEKWARMLRRVLEYWRQLMSFDFYWKPQVTSWLYNSNTT